MLVGSPDPNPPATVVMMAGGVLAAASWGANSVVNGVPNRTGQVATRQAREHSRRRSRLWRGALPTGIVSGNVTTIVPSFPRLIFAGPLTGTSGLL